jgi:SAM-dependent methyltransferase
MDDERALSTGDRVLRLLRNLGIARAHFAMGAAEAAARPELAASLTLVTPGAGQSIPLRRLAAARTLAIPPLVIHGDAGPLSGGAAPVLAAYPGATAVVLREQTTALWTDTIAERAGEIAPALLAHLAAAQGRDPLPPLRLPEADGEVAGVTYRARGGGPPLLLFPLLLAPSQWDALIPALADHYCVITLGGPHLGLVAPLEQRAAGGYGAVVDGLIDALTLPEGGTALEAGCGTGALTRRLARRVGPAGRVVGADINAYLLREAAALAGRAGLADRLTFRPGDVEALPFPDAGFDAALACTVLDEADADRGLAELARVVRPGGRVAVLVRADDLPSWDSLPLGSALRAKLRARTAAGVTAGGCADPSLYRRFRAQGFTGVTLGPRYAVDRPEDGLPAWQDYFAGHVLGALDEAEAAEWRAAAARATAEGSFLWSWSYHCAVGTRP